MFALASNMLKSLQVRSVCLQRGCGLNLTCYIHCRIAFSMTTGKDDRKICNIIKSRCSEHVRKYNSGESLVPNALLHSYIGGALINGYRVISSSGISFQHFWVDKYGEIFDASVSLSEVQNVESNKHSKRDFEYSKRAEGIEYDKIEQPVVRKQHDKDYQLYNNDPKAFFNSISPQLKRFVDACNNDLGGNTSE